MTVSTTVPPEPNIRPCILCGADDAEHLFTFTYDFMVNVRGHEAADLSDKEWTEDVTSTIVKCRKCAAIYIRDPQIWPDQYWVKRNNQFHLAAAFEERKRRVASRETYRHYHPVDAQNWTVRNLIIMAANQQKRDIKFLDYGAGGAETSNMARVCAVHDVVAYDPHYTENIQDHHNAANFPGIRSTGDKELLSELGPFDAVVFQSAIEHVSDPREELESIFSLMTPGGYLYVNNPVMDLDRELDQLKAATKIVKKDRISYYHPEHLNYMTSRQFQDLLRSVGFRITSRTHYPPVPLTKDSVRPFLLRGLKVAIRTVQNVLRLPYDRQYFIVEKPS